MVTDSKGLQEVLAGHSVLEEEEARPYLCKCTETLVRLRALGWCAPMVGEDPWLWRPRGFNRCADKVCNIAMDNKRSFGKFFPTDVDNPDGVRKFIMRG